MKELGQAKGEKVELGEGGWGREKGVWFRYKPESFGLEVRSLWSSNLINRTKIPPEKRMIALWRNKQREEEKGTTTPCCLCS